eukprot:m.136903 g.136903  ORF g.136903 m.136903 type:complete len:2486 (+) comp23973_c0_seq1:94-7551(+)
MAADTIHLGDTVSLYFESHKGGYVFSETTLQPRVLVRESNKDQPHVSNVHAYTFELLVQTKFQALRRLKQELKRKFENKKVDLDDLEDIAAEHNDIAKLKKHADAEAEDNRIEQLRQRGKQLMYGQIVQLRHTFSGRFLKANTSETASLDHSNMKVNLAVDANRDCSFRVMPRYRIRSEGDVVRVNDQIILESVRTGNYLHVSAKAFDNSFLEHRTYEVDLSVNKTAFAIAPFGVNPEFSPQGVVKCGDVVRFFHKELEAYLAAEGVFGSDELLEDVHLRVRPDFKSSRSVLPTATILFWQVESLQTMAGGVVQWEVYCRLRHLTTRKYLAVQKGKLTLVPKAGGMECVFRLFADVQNSVNVAYDSYAHISNADGTWIRALKDEQNKPTPYNRKQYLGFEDESRKGSMATLKWDQAEVYQIRCDLENRSDDDAFVVSVVPQDQINDFNFVAGMIPRFNFFIQQRTSGVRLTVPMMHHVQEHLKSLEAFQRRRGEPIKQRQKLLRHLGLIETFIAILKLLKPGLIPGHRTFEQRLSKRIYHVIQTYLEGDSRKNELYLARYISFFQSQISDGVESAGMLMELVRDNHKILDRIEHAQIDEFITLLESEKDPMFLDFLGVLCICEGESVPKNQNYIVKRLLVDYQHKRLVYLTDVHDARGGKRVVKVKTDSNDDVEIDKFVEIKTDDPDAHRRLEYLERQLALFGELCFDRNDYAIDVITQQLHYLTWEEAFLCLNDKHLPPVLRKAYTDLILSLFVDVDPNIPDLERVDLTYVYKDVTDQPDLSASADPTLSTTGARFHQFPQLRDWIANFFSHHTSQTASQVELNHFIASVLRLTRYLVMFGYYSNIKDVKALLTPMTSMLDGTNDRPIPEINESARKEWVAEQRYHRGERTLACVSAKVEAMHVLELLFNFRMRERMLLFLNIFKQKKGKHILNHMQGVYKNKTDAPSNVGTPDDDVSVMTDIFHNTDYLNPNGDLVDVLLDLSKYEYEETTTTAMRLMHRFFNGHTEIFEKCVQAQVLISDKSIHVHEELMGLLPKFRHLISTEMVEKQEQEMLEILRTFTGYCTLNGSKDLDENEELEEHATNQNILFNAGVFEDILTLLAKEIDLSIDAGLVDIFRQAFKFLRVFTMHFNVVQRRLFERLDFILNIGVAEEEMALAVAEVFTGNKDLCLGIKESQIHTVLKLLAKNNQANNKTPSLLYTLQAIVKVEEINLPLKRNQNFVMKYLSQYRSRVLLLMDNAALQGPNSVDVDYHTQIVDLLATLAEGENRFIESVCQTIFSIEDVLQVLTHRSIPLPRKIPYLRFLLWVYLNTASGSVESGTAFIHTNPQMWDFIGLLHEFLQSLLRNIDLENARALRKRFGHHELVFIFEGIVPFLRVFYGEYYEDSNAERHHKDLSAKLCHTIDELVDIASKFVHDKEQYASLTHAAMTLATKIQVSEEELEHLATKIAHDSASGAKMMSEDRHKYEDEFSVQDELNRILNVWVTKVQDAYEKLDGIIHEEADEEGQSFDHDLPRGQEFQDHMNVFLKFHNQHNSAYLRGQPQPIEYVRSESRKLVDQLAISNKHRGRLKESERDKENEISVKSLQLMRGMIHHEKSRLPPGATHDSHPKLYESTWANIRKIQNQFDEYNAPLTMIALLAHENDAIVKEAMKLLISMLQGDNLAVQRTFEHYFLDTREEVFFRDVKARLQASVVALKERKLLMSQFARQAEKRNEMVTTLMKSTMAGKAGNRMAEAAQAKTEEEFDELVPEAMEEEEEEEVDFSFKDVSGSKLMMRILENICGGEHEINQNYMRIQEDNNTSINIVSELMQYLNALYMNIDKDTIIVTIELLTTLTEICLGNSANQSVLFDEKILDPINTLMRQQDFKGCRRKAVARLKLETANLTLSLIEQSNEEAQRMAQELIESLDLKAVHANMNRYHYEDYLYKRMNKKQAPYDALKVGITYFTILMRLSDFNKGKEFTPEIVFPVKATRKVALIEDEEEEPQAEEEEKGIDFESIKDSQYDYFKDKTGSIEILRDGDLQKIHFPIRSKAALRDTVKEELLWNIDRSHGPVDKVRDFVLRARRIIADMKRQNRLLRNPYTGFLVRNSLQWRKIVMLLTVLLNILMLATFDANLDFDVMTPQRPSWFDPVLYFFGSLHVIFSFFLVLEYYLSGTRKAKDARNPNAPPPDRVEVIQEAIFDWIPTGTTIYHTMFLIASILGVIWHGYFFSFHLLHFATDNDVLARVFKAVTTSGSALLWVTFLALIVIYMYALLAFAFMRHSFRDEDGLFCDDMGQCFVSVVSHGLRAGGGLGEVLVPFTFDWSEAGWRVAFDLSFWIIITIIGLNIVFTVIVGTFARLREERAMIEEDLARVCIICSLQSYDFERFAQGFDYHKKHEHNLFNYLWFMVYLDEKDEVDYTSHEAFVARMLEENDLSFFPVNRAMSLKDMGRDLVTERLQEIENLVSNLVNRYKKQEQSKLREDELNRAEAAKNTLLSETT